MKGIILLFLEPYAAGTRDSEKYIFPDLKKISVTINGSPNMLYNNSIESRDIWSEVSRFFMKEDYKPQHMNLQKFYAKNKFGPLIDLAQWKAKKCMAAAPVSLTPQMGSSWKLSETPKVRGQLTATSTSSPTLSLTLSTSS